MKIRALKLKDRSFDNWHSELEDHWDYEDMLAHGEPGIHLYVLNRSRAAMAPAVQRCFEQVR